MIKMRAEVSKSEKKKKQATEKPNSEKKTLIGIMVSSIDYLRKK